VREKEVAPGSERVGSHVTVSDINQAMLDVGRKRAEKGLVLGKGDTIDWHCANAEDLNQIPDESYSAYTIAFGIRLDIRTLD
jgi:2-methoxy-6-polyprenyl-1,4-benzoquinol methylase